MKSRTVICLMIAAVLAAALAGCTGGAKSSSGSGTKPAAGSAPTLTKATLPTKVGTKWSMVRIDTQGTPVDLSAKGPWDFQAGADWRPSSYEIVDPATVPGIDAFKDYTFVLKTQAPDSPAYYYPRQVTDAWVMAMGRIDTSGGTTKPEPSPLAKFWPLGFEVGQTYTVVDSDVATTKAEVLGRNTVKVPAGTIEDAYLVLFHTEYKDGRQANDNAYIFAPDVGMVAYFGTVTGDKKNGFTKAWSVIVLETMPK